MAVMRTLDIPATAAQIIAFLQRIVREAGFSRIVMNVSGGVDSATSLALAVAALGPEAVFPLSLPYRDWHTEADLRTQRLLRELRIPASHLRKVDISPMVDAFVATLGIHRHGDHILAGDRLTHVRLGNIMARVRMICLYDYAKERSALVLGTENKSEHFLGYYTRFGDEASDIEPLRNLYKLEIYQLAEYLGVPEEIRAATPSAGLWPGQTDEGEFGFSYEIADPVLYGLYEAGRSPEELASQGLDRQAIARVQAWVTQMSFKHSLPHMAPEPVILSR